MDAASCLRARLHSLKEERALEAHLNGHAHFPDTGQRIECRHLALDWLEQLRISPTGKPDYGALRSTQAIAAHVPSAREGQYYALLAHAVRIAGAAAQTVLTSLSRWRERAGVRASRRPSAVEQAAIRDAQPRGKTALTPPRASRGSRRAPSPRPSPASGRGSGRADSYASVISWIVTPVLRRCDSPAARAAASVSAWLMLAPTAASSAACCSAGRSAE